MKKFYSENAIDLGDKVLAKYYLKDKLIILEKM